MGAAAATRDANSHCGTLRRAGRGRAAPRRPDTLRLTLIEGQTSTGTTRVQVVNVVHGHSRLWKNALLLNSNRKSDEGKTGLKYKGGRLAEMGGGWQKEIVK
ncbi:hypothetical protein EVAR_56783_1 [Eumeta japonica]|uniref:Uncharacterized protein n=1 Tax=Eumeta variegata TaxID=151549 RepID=A0A4C1YWD4_EUMVA|nr:hypothetical protein EVAR_56783_1 [Eumeta japonica]